MIKQTDLKEQQQKNSHFFLLLGYYVADPATFLASGSLLGTLIYFENRLFTNGSEIE